MLAALTASDGGECSTVNRYCAVTRSVARVVFNFHANYVRRKSQIDVADDTQTYSAIDGEITPLVRHKTRQLIQRLNMSWVNPWVQWVKPRPHQQQCRSNVRLCRSNIWLVAKMATMSTEISSFRQSPNKLNMFNLFRLCRKNCSTCSIRQCCFDIVAGVDGALGWIELDCDCIRCGLLLHYGVAWSVFLSVCVSVFRSRSCVLQNG